MTTLESHLEVIRRDLDDPAPYLVLADWLQEQGDPWGRLIALQHELEQRPGDSALAAEAEALIKKQRWLPKHKLGLLRLEWCRGFISAIRIYDAYSAADLDALLESLLELPLASLVRSCRLFRKRGVDGAYVRPAVFDRLPSTTTAEVLEPVELDVAQSPAERRERLAAAGGEVRWVEVRGGVPEEVAELTELAMLSCQEVAVLPGWLGKLPLERLELWWCFELTGLPDELWSLESLGFLDLIDCPGIELNNGHVNNLLAGFARARTPAAQRLVELALMQRESPDASVPQLLSALDSNVKAVRARALELLGERLPSPLGEHPLGKGSVVTLAGSLNSDRKVLKTRLEGVGAKLATKLTDKTTHVLLGETPKGKQREVGERPLVLEAHLLAANDGAERASVALDTAQLAKDLRSKQDRRIVAAVAALQQHGGVPSELLPELFLVLQNTALDKLGSGRKQARKLFAAFAPARLKDIMAEDFRTSVLLAGETKRAYRLQFLEGLIDVKRLARLMLEDFECGLKFILGTRDEAEIRWALEGRRISGDVLDLSALELSRLPDLSGFGDVHTLKATNNRLTKLPLARRLPPKLTTLVLRRNRLASLPRKLASYASLQRLDLAENNLESFPQGVLTLPALRELDLSSSAWGPHITKIPKEIVALTQLEVLRVANGRVPVEVPPEIGAMSWLRRLEVTWDDSSKTPPAELAALLPDCEIRKA